MTARAWTREALDAAHPQVKAAGWTWSEKSAADACIMAARGDAQCYVVDGELRLFRCPYPDIDVVIAVGLASKGMDSLGVMAAALTADADEHAGEACSPWRVGLADGLRAAAQMIRRGRVAP